MQSSVRTSRDDLTRAPPDKQQVYTEGPSRTQANTENTTSNTQKRSRSHDSLDITHSDTARQQVARQQVPVARYSETQQGTTDNYKSYNSLQRQPRDNYKPRDTYQSLPRDMHRAQNSTYTTYPVNVSSNPTTSSTLPRRDDAMLR